MSLTSFCDVETLDMVALQSLSRATVLQQVIVHVRIIVVHGVKVTVTCPERVCLRPDASGSKQCVWMMREFTADCLTA